MSRLEWHDTLNPINEVGVDRGFLFPESGPGVPWRGLTKIVEKRSGGEPNPSYIDGFKYRNDATSEDLEITLEAYSYPEEFRASNGMTDVVPGIEVGQQGKRPFSFCYRTLLDDGRTTDHKLHLVYDALALSPTIEYTTVSDTPEGFLFSWPLVLVHHAIDGYAPSMHISIDETQVKVANFTEFENLLYGLNGNPPWLPTMEDIFNFFRYDLVALHIQENEEMGISLLTDDTPADLIGFRETGMYWRAGTSRLNETSTDGIYDLE